MSTLINNDKFDIKRILSITLIALLAIASSAFSQANIENNFTRANNADFSGSYEVSGLLSDSTPYVGSLKLEKWNTFTTPMGNVLQSFKMEYRYGESKSNGVAVFDGHRLYYASGEGEHDSYYLLILSKLEFSQDAHSSLRKYNEARRTMEKDHYIKWDGETPWYGFVNIDAQAYGYWFWIDGIWGQYSTWQNGFPHTADSGLFRMMELKKSGEFGKIRGGGFPEGYWEGGTYVVTPVGENLQIDVSWYKSGGKTNSTWGSGMMTTHPVTGDSMLVAMVGGPENTSFGWLEISGSKLSGTCTYQGNELRGTEEWAVPDDVIKKNPAWFK